MDQKKRYTALAKVVKITPVHQHRSSKEPFRNRAHVEFTDHNGSPARGDFFIAGTPMYTTIRLNSLVEIEYGQDTQFGKYPVSLQDPHRYDRVPTQAELDTSRRHRDRILMKGLIGVGGVFIMSTLFGMLHTPFVFILAVPVAYMAVKFDAKQGKLDRDALRNWSVPAQKEEQEKSTL